MYSRLCRGYNWSSCSWLHVDLQEQIKKKLQAVQQKLQTDRTFAPNYKEAMEALVAKETKMYQQYAKAGWKKEAKVLMERVKAMQAELRKLKQHDRCVAVVVNA